MEFLVLSLIFGIVYGVIAAAIASSKGRSVPGWFFGGFFGGLICVIVVACLPNLIAERNYRMQVEMANHRLREQLRQERMKTESFRQYSMTRLDAHDQALGIDTRQTGPMLGGAGPVRQIGGESQAAALDRMTAEASGQQPQAQQQAQSFGPADQNPYAAPAPVPGDGAQSWFFAHGGQSFGPVTRMSVIQMLQDRTLTPTSLLWTEGMPDWAPICELPAFRNAVIL